MSLFKKETRKETVSPFKSFHPRKPHQRSFHPFQIMTSPEYHVGETTFVKKRKRSKKFSSSKTRVPVLLEDPKNRATENSSMRPLKVNTLPREHHYDFTTQNCWDLVVMSLIQLFHITVYHRMQIVTLWIIICHNLVYFINNLTTDSYII